jgi:hypothetical protein
MNDFKFHLNNELSKICVNKSCGLVKIDRLKIGPYPA